MIKRRTEQEEQLYDKRKVVGRKREGWEVNDGKREEGKEEERSLRRFNHVTSNPLKGNDMRRRKRIK